jgi:hypothetical protein
MLGSLTGSGTGNYTNTHSITFPVGDGVKNLQGYFERGFEPYYSNTLSYYLDTLPPTKPLSLAPSDNTTIS